MKRRNLVENLAVGNVAISNVSYIKWDTSKRMANVNAPVRLINDI